jgi:tetratricopeptide (TPR) repeat protein
MDAAHRQEAAGRLAGLPSGMGHPALLRLLQEEPSDQVKWFVVSLLRGRHLPGDLAALRDMPVTSASRSAPLLAAVGWAWQGKDPAKAQAILREAVAVEAVHPSLDAGAMDFAFNVLVREAVASQRYNEAAALLRRRCIRAGSVTSEQRLVDGVAELFALHARFGPLQGWEEDQRVFAAYLTRPQVLYALARLCDQKGDTLLGNALRQAAWAVSLDSCEEHWIAAEFLATRHWDSWARRELETLLTLSEEAAARGGATPASEVYTANAHFRLAGLTMRRGDDFGTAEHLRLAMEAMERIGRGAGLVAGAQQEEARPITGPAIWAEIRWRYFRAARAKGDAAEMRKQLDELLKLPCDNADMVPDVVPALKQMGRAEDASRLFATAYASMKARMDAEPGEAEHMNNLAWLCARSDERLEEALKLATAAVQAAPDNSAYLDTAAEVHFRLGHAEEAVRLEKRAIELRPNDGFMREQLKRFEGKGESQGTKAPRH